MAQTPANKRLAEISSALGYARPEGSSYGCVDLQEFSIGDGIIVLRKTGEPAMTGKVLDIEPPMHEESKGRVNVDGQWYYGSDYKFRPL